jgi:hypothetical protein
LACQGGRGRLGVPRVIDMLCCALRSPAQLVARRELPLWRRRQIAAGPAPARSWTLGLLHDQHFPSSSATPPANDSGAAEDALSEVFVRLLTFMRPRAALQYPGWLFGTLRHIATSYRRPSHGPTRSPKRLFGDLDSAIKPATSRSAPGAAFPTSEQQHVQPPLRRRLHA